MSRWCPLTLLLSLAFPCVVSAQAGYPDGTGIVPAGWHSQAPADAYGYPSGYGPRMSYGRSSPLPPGPPPTIYEQLPDDQGWLYDDSPLERFLKGAFRRASFRVDYLLWDIEDPGDDILGAPNSAVPELSGLYTLVDDNGNNIDVYQPTLSAVQINENNGIRGTVAMPIFRAGTLELSAFALQTSTSTVPFPDVRAIDTDGDGLVDSASGFIPAQDLDLDSDPLTGVTTGQVAVSNNIVDAVGQAVLVGGIAGSTFRLLNDIDYEARLRTSVWGGEGNFVFDPTNPNADIQIQPLIGFRYFNFSEDLYQTGVYTFTAADPATTPPTPAVTGVRHIDASAKNNLYGPQIGLRSAWNTRWFSVGVQPKVMLGLNSYRTEVSTLGVLTPTEGYRVVVDKETTFGVLGDLEVFTQLKMTDHFSVFAAYDLMWAGMITRPADDIIYNVQPQTANIPEQSAFGLDVGFSGAMLQGLSVGAQLQY